MMPHGMGMGRGGMLGGGAAGMARMGGAYGGPVVHQVQSGYSASDIGGSVQPVMAVPNPSYLPSSSGAGIRQPAPPYDSVGVSWCVCVCVCCLQQMQSICLSSTLLTPTHKISVFVGTLALSLSLSLSCSLQPQVQLLLSPLSSMSPHLPPPSLPPPPLLSRLQCHRQLPPSLTPHSLPLTLPPHQHHCRPPQLLQTCCK